MMLHLLVDVHRNQRLLIFEDSQQLLKCFKGSIDNFSYLHRNAEQSTVSLKDLHLKHLIHEAGPIVLPLDQTGGGIYVTPRNTLKHTTENNL
jgi:hypothetical protein